MHALGFPLGNVVVPKIASAKVHRACMRDGEINASWQCRKTSLMLLAASMCAAWWLVRHVQDSILGQVPGKMVACAAWDPKLLA